MNRNDQKLVDKRSFNLKGLRLMLLLSMFFLVNACGNPSKNSSEKVESATKNIAVKKPSVIEVIGAEGTAPNVDSLEKICKQNDIPASAVYQWKNHIVIFRVIKEAQEMRKQLMVQFPKAAVKLYNTPFYDFNRKRCGDVQIAKDWDNIIMTADLVKDPKMQQEYLAYHATQFQKWPEVANGFLQR